MAFFASKIKMSYEFSKAIPTDNIKYRDYLAYKEKFGDDGNVLVIGAQSEQFFKLKNFQHFIGLTESLKKVPYVENVLSVANTVNLLKDSVNEKLDAIPIFSKHPQSQAEIDSSLAVFYSLPFYRSLLYNPATNAYLIVVRINKEILNSSGRTAVIRNIVDKANNFTVATGIQTHISGLPLIRTQVADRIAHEMKWFIIGSLALSAFILLLLFRSLQTTLLSLCVVIVSVIWSVGIMYLFGY